MAGFEKRTGLRYAPGAAPPGARALRARETCPTLFRYPGPDGLLELLQGSLRRLAPPGRPLVWLERDPRGRAGQPRSVRLFGTAAILQPLRLSPWAAPAAGVYLAENAAVDPGAGLVWVPPPALAAGLPWDRLRTPRQLLERVGSGYADAREATLERLRRYLEELDALRRAGAPPPERPWCGLPAKRRRALLERYGVRPSWSGP